MPSCVSLPFLWYTRAHVYYVHKYIERRFVRALSALRTKERRLAGGSVCSVWMARIRMCACANALRVYIRTYYIFYYCLFHHGTIGPFLVPLARSHNRNVNRFLLFMSFRTNSDSYWIHKVEMKCFSIRAVCVCGRVCVCVWVLSVRCARRALSHPQWLGRCRRALIQYQTHKSPDGWGRGRGSNALDRKY